VLLSIATLFVLLYMYRQTPREDRVQIASIALICGGAVGNLLDRIKSPRGVVDFIDIGIGSHRFWTFNLADLGVTLGTAILTWILCTRASREQAAVQTAPTPAPALSRSRFEEPN
jgi:signal peptidase II